MFNINIAVSLYTKIVLFLSDCVAVMLALFRDNNFKIVSCT